jgi:pyruvate kinase
MAGHGTKARARSKPVLDGAAEVAALLAALTTLRQDIERESPAILKDLGAPIDAPAPIRNLAHYLAIRRRDLRDLQRRLMPLGLSSLGRLESRVLPTLDAVIGALHRLDGQAAPEGLVAPDRFFAGEAGLDEATDALFGSPRAHRRGRIMVTLPSEAAEDAGLVRDLIAAGMDVARINCAHDDAERWAAMACHVRREAAAAGVACRVLMDIAGPKIRTEAVAAHDRKARMAVGDALTLREGGHPTASAAHPFVAVPSYPEIVRRLRIGDRVRYDDGKAEGVAEDLRPGEALIRLTRVKTGGVKLKPEKGLNLPDTVLGLAPLTAEDETDLAAVVKTADMIGYSFVSEPEDIDLLDAALARQGIGDRRLGLVAKIERPEAIGNLPALIVRAAGRGPFGVMIARGDLAAEIGFERLAEMQEEILWICEAASVPVIWATQVLESLVKDGIPSRGEMTDAVMGTRAECMMLNKGPKVVDAVALLDRLQVRMGEHMLKKTPTLRALRSW